MIYQFKIQIRGVKKPPVWRRIQVPGQFTFDEFHSVIQASFEWLDEHLYAFGYQPYDLELYISVPSEDDDDYDRPTFDSRELTIEDFFTHYSRKNKLCYVYDFGEDWIHDVTLEEKIEGYADRATCIAGKSNWSEIETLGNFDEDEDDDDDSWPRPNPEGFDLEYINERVGEVEHLSPNKQSEKNFEKKVKQSITQHRIYPAEWIKRQPYSVITNIDQYYVGIANRVLEILDNNKDELDASGIDSDDREVMAIALTTWFEDVIAQGGIWKSFIYECKKRYGRYLPFYHINEEEYYDDEVNPEDVRFLVWHYLQYFHNSQSIINPENLFITMLSDSIYDIFDSEFENAPINDEWHNALHPAGFDSSLLFSYREYLYKLIDCNYLYLSLHESIHDFIEDALSDINHSDTAHESIHDYVTGCLFEGKENFLGLSMAQWGTEIIRLENKSLAQRLDTIKTRPTRIYAVVGEDKTHFHFLDYVDERLDRRDAVYKVNKDAFGNYPANAYTESEKYSICRLTCCEGEWNLNGSSYIIPREDVEKKIENIPPQYRNDASTDTKAVNKMLEITGGKRLYFPKDTKETLAFIKKVFETTDAKGITFPTTVNNLVVFGSSILGIGIAGGICECIKCSDNPYYNEDVAKKNAIGLLVDTSSLTHDIVCYMFDNGMLSDAALASTEGYDHGRQLVQENAQFLIDYFLHGKRA